MAKMSKIIHVAVEPSLWRQLQEVAKRDSVPVSYVIRRILRTELSKEQAAA